MKENLRGFFKLFKTKGEITSLKGDNFFSIFKRFLPIIFFSALLPLFVFFVFQPPNFSFFPSATGESRLRLWLEPTAIGLKPGTTTTFKVMANFENDRELVPGIRVLVISSSGLEVLNPKVSYELPFKGQMVLGEVAVKANDTGTHNLIVSKEAVEVVGEVGEFEVVVSPARVIVKD